MFEKIANIFRIPDLRKRVFFTLGLLAVYRLGAFIPTPGVNSTALNQFFNTYSGSALGLMDLFTGGNLRKLTIFALGIMPYITASIIFQLLTVIYEPLAKLQKEGELGRRKITQWTRYVTVLLGLIQSLAIAWTLSSPSANMANIPRGYFIPLCVITLTAGTAFIMWLGEQITDRGIGNGMSLLIFTGIVVGLPRGVGDLYQKVRDNAWGALTLPGVVLLVAAMIAIVGFIVWVERSERRIQVQYAKRIVGRKMMGGQSTHLPLKVNSGGVMPIIFASSMLSLPLLLSGHSFFGSAKIEDTAFFGPILRNIAPGEPWYVLLNAVAIIFFAYFYISIVFRPDDIADNMRKYGGFVPGIRPGRRTSDFINDVLTRITLVGALYLVVVQLIPGILLTGIHFNHLPLIGGFFDRLPTWMTQGLGVTFYFGGTSLLIVVGVAMDTVQQVESQLIMRHYEGFSPQEWPHPRTAELVGATTLSADASARAEHAESFLPGPVLLLGAPGVGKGTQAKRLMAQYGIPQISTGDILRAVRSEAHTPEGAEAKRLMDQGLLVPDDIVNQLVADRLCEPDTARGYILDGFPRTLPQANWLDEHLVSECAGHALVAPVVAISVVVEYKHLLERITGRRISAAGRIYNIYFDPPKVEGICDVDGTSLTQRPDDTEAVFAERMRTFEELTAPVVAHYRTAGRFEEINGDQPVEAVTTNIDAALHRMRRA